MEIRRDFLPAEAARLRRVEARLRAAFEARGYGEVIPSTFERADLLDRLDGREWASRLYQFFGEDGRVVTLRPDFTAAIARVVATRLPRGEAGPYRFYYVGTVFRRPAGADEPGELWQAGAELVDAPGPPADAELLRLALDVAAATGLPAFVVEVGHVQFVEGLLAELPPPWATRIREALVRRNRVDFLELVASAPLSPARRRALEALPRLRGGPEVLEAARALGPGEEAARGLHELAALLEAAGPPEAEAGVSVRFCLDLGLLRPLPYYTGVVFEGYTPGVGRLLLSGGRYDALFARFGAARPAVGFAVDLEGVLLARDGRAAAGALWRGGEGGL